MAMDGKFLDVETLTPEQKINLAHALVQYHPYPWFMFGDRFLFSVSSKVPMDKAEMGIISACFNECANKLRSYYEYMGKSI